MGLGESIRRRRYAIALAAIVLLGLSLRVYQVGAKSLWLDEAWSTWASQQPFTGVFTAVRQDVNPPLYFVLLHFWLRLNDSEASIRLLSALCSILNIPVIYLLGRKIAGRPLGLLAALILAVSPFHVLYAQEARMYAMLSLFASLSLYFVVRLLSDPQAANAPLGRGLAAWWRSRRAASHWGKPTPQASLAASRAGGEEFGSRASLDISPSPRAALVTDLSWLGFMFSTAAAMLTHNTAVFLPLGLNYYVLGKYLAHRITTHKAQVATQNQSRQPTGRVLSQGFIRNWLVAQLGALLLFSPWLPSLLAQSARVTRGFWVQPPTLSTVYDAWRGLSSAGAPQCGPCNLLIALLFPGLVALGLIYLYRRPHWPALLIVIGLAPFAGELAISLRRPIFSVRTLIWASIPYYLLLAAGLLQLRRRPLVLATLSVLMVINGSSLAGYYANNQIEQWREATSYICERASDQDLVILSADYTDKAFDFYRQRCSKGFDRLGMNATAENLATLPELVAGRPRVWLVYSYDVWGDPQHLLAKALSEELRLAHVERFAGVDVVEYTR